MRSEISLGPSELLCAHTLMGGIHSAIQYAFAFAVKVASIADELSDDAPRLNQLL